MIVLPSSFVEIPPRKVVLFHLYPAFVHNPHPLHLTIAAAPKWRYLNKVLGVDLLTRCGEAECVLVASYCIAVGTLFSKVDFMYILDLFSAVNRFYILLHP